MFSGIVEEAGKVIAIEKDQENVHFTLTCSFVDDLKIDQSLSHNGVCLTVEEINGNTYKVTAIKETLYITNLNEWKTGNIVNLERSMQMNGRIDGHIVQGHVDTIAICIDKKELNGSTEFTFRVKKKFAPLVIEKGSICVNGVSLTAFNVRKKKFTVAIIPYTFQHTNLSYVKEGSKVNIEFDFMGKYVTRIALLKDN